MGHTPEPWYAEMNSVFWEFGWFNEGNFVQIGDTCSSSAAEPYYGQSLALGEANARRIVACVNACTGMADPAGEIARLRAIEKVLADMVRDYYDTEGDIAIKTHMGLATKALSAKEAE